MAESIEPRRAVTISEVAQKRGWQTLAQGLLIDVLVAVALVVAAIVPGIETWQQIGDMWPVWLLLVTKSVVQAVVAWVLRRYRDGSGVEPIAPPTEPSP